MKEKKKKVIIDICKYCNKPKREHTYPEWDVHHVKYMNEMRDLSR